MPPRSESRDLVLDRIADHLDARRPGHPLRVAVDGITAAGKTTLADELGAALHARGRPTLRLSMDGYHNPRAHRHRQGRDSARGYYEDAYDFASFARLVLEPLGPGGDRRIQPAIIDLASDRPVDAAPVVVDPDAVVVVDGSFLQGPALAAWWDEVVFVDAGFDQARARGSQRDAAAFGSEAAADEAYRRRYHAAGQMYVDDVDPRRRASIVVDNNDPQTPLLQRLGGLELT